MRTGCAASRSSACCVNCCGASCRCRSRSLPATCARASPTAHGSSSNGWSACVPFSELAANEGGDAPWEQTGRLIAKFHREGLDHADLNATNILFDEGGKGWLIDFDRGRMHIPETAWRTRNLARLQRSLHKHPGGRSAAQIDADFARLRAAYDARWAKGN